MPDYIAIRHRELAHELHGRLYFLLFEGYDKVVALPLVQLSKLTFRCKHFLQSSVSYSCLVDAG